MGKGQAAGLGNGKGKVEDTQTFHGEPDLIPRLTPPSP
jgi:hypothetical protein